VNFTEVTLMNTMAVIAAMKEEMRMSRLTTPGVEIARGIPAIEGHSPRTKVVARTAITLMLIVGIAAIAGISGEIHGTVLDSNGQPPPQTAVIRIFSPCGTWIVPLDGLGRYRATGLPSCIYNVALALTPPAENLWFEGVPVIAEESVEVNFDLSQGGIVVGNVLDASGLPVQRAMLRVFKAGPYSPSGFDTGFATTDAMGNYEVHGLDEGIYNVALALTPPAENLWFEGVPVIAEESVEASFDLTQGAAIAGRITTASGETVIGFSIRVFRTSPVAVPALSTGFAVSNPDGSYSVVGLAVGTYTVVLELPGATESLWRDGVDAGLDANSEANFEVGDEWGTGVPDRDNDGVPDDEDYCPDFPGKVITNGC
jgi:hypothetical protein